LNLLKGVSIFDIIFAKKKIKRPFSYNFDKMPIFVNGDLLKIIFPFWLKYYDNSK